MSAGTAVETLFNPGSVVVVGASARPGSIGAIAWHNLRSAAFDGAVYAVNPRHRRLDGQTVYARVADLPAPADLALVCTPAAAVAEVIAELGRCGTRVAVVLSSALDAVQRQAMLDAAHAQRLRVLGPGSAGLLAPHLRLNAGIAHRDAAPGELALVSQSASLAAAMLDWARARDIGFSTVLSLGAQADIDVADLLDHLASDSRTRAILLCLESTHAPRRFLSAARSAARNKPVIVVRWAAHGAAAAADRVYDAVIARAGMLRVASLQEMLLAAETLARFRTNRSEQLLILSNGSGAAALAAQAAARAGLRLATLQDSTLQAVQPLLARPAVPTAPLVLRADASPAQVAQALQLLADDASAPALLSIHAPVAAVPSAQLARALLPLAQLAPPRLIGCWLGHAEVAEARRVFQQAGLPSYATPEEAVQAMAMLVSYRRNQAQLIEAPPSAGGDVAADAAAARTLVQAALGAGRTLLDADETRRLLAAYGIAVRAAVQVEPEPYAAASAAEKTGYPVMLKIVSPDITPGFDGGSMALDLRSAVQVRDAARRLLAGSARAWPLARIDGFSVEAMALPADARVLSAGTRIDPLFGPVILLGSDGQLDAAAGAPTVALPPLNLPLAHALLQRSGVAALLRGQPGAQAADSAALQRVLVGLSQLLIDVSQVAEVSLRPLLVGSDGVLAMQAQVLLSVAAPAGALNFAIRPYPSHLVETLPWHGGTLTLRPIRPEDEVQHTTFLSKMDPADVRMRVFYSRRSIERSELARLTQIDYAREMAFVAVDSGPDGEPRTLGVVRAIADADNASAEFGIVIRSDMKGHGLGMMLMQRIIDYQRSHGTSKLVATVLAENTRMLQLTQHLGFVEKASDEGAGVRYVELAL